MPKENYTIRLSSEVKSWFKQKGGARYIEHLASLEGVGTVGRGPVKGSSTWEALQVLNALVEKGQPFVMKTPTDKLLKKNPDLTKKAAQSACQRALAKYYPELPYTDEGPKGGKRVYL